MWLVQKHGNLLTQPFTVDITKLAKTILDWSFIPYPRINGIYHLYLKYTFFTKWYRTQVTFYHLLPPPPTKKVVRLMHGPFWIWHQIIVLRQT